MSDSIFQVISNCRICEKDRLNNILDLGEQPPANSLRDNLEEPLPFVPLSIVHCDNCRTVQLKETVKPEYLFSKYVWVTGTSSTAQTYSSFFCDEALTRLPDRELFVAEVASNDGTFLKRFKDKGHKVLGIDPARNIAQIAIDKGIPTQVEFFDHKIAESIVTEHGKADCIFARNVIPHVENIHGVISGMAHCIKDEGIAIVEFHYGENIMSELQYDSIYHEHLFYFSFQSLRYLLEKHGLSPFDYNVSPISGGSIALYCSKNNRPETSRLKKKLEMDENSGLGLKEKWLEFSEKCFDHKNKLIEVVKTHSGNGTKMIGYGASARSSTLLNFCGIDHRHLTCIADGNPIKHGKFTAGTDIPIVSPGEAFAKNPDTVLLLGWNFKDEILKIIKDQYQFHGKVILPLPNDPQIIEL
ncbi:MAG: class I SAM-dependent methyltransferase [Nitrospina sp.]|jgi:hypothetical protein|nr:class I SAM-dependent methyltransferase [Nitrospina sp.]